MTEIIHNIQQPIRVFLGFFLENKKIEINLLRLSPSKCASPTIFLPIKFGKRKHYNFFY